MIFTSLSRFSKPVAIATFLYPSRATPSGLPSLVSQFILLALQCCDRLPLSHSPFDSRGNSPLLMSTNSSDRTAMAADLYRKMLVASSSLESSSSNSDFSAASTSSAIVNASFRNRALSSSSEKARRRRRVRMRSPEDQSTSTFDIRFLMGGALGVELARPVKRLKSYVDNPAITLQPITFEAITCFYGPDRFQKTYRMSLCSFNILLERIRDRLELRYVARSEYRWETVPAEIRLAITLRFLAGGNYDELSLAYQVKASTVYDIFHATCDTLQDRLKLKGFPETEEGMQELADGFKSSRKELSPLTGCVGAIDGICFKIKMPRANENPATFHSRKGFYALPVQALCDSNYIFLYCSAKCTGSTHDALAYAVSGLKEDIDSGILRLIFYIVGDEAYICTSELLTPFSKDAADYDQDNFNYFLSSLRMHIEQAFGMLVARWRILRGGLDFSVRRCTDIVCLLMKLQNFCLENDKPGSTFTKSLSEGEKHLLETDVNQWYELANEVAEEFHERAQSRVQSRGDFRRAHNRRDLLVDIVKQKNRYRPAAVPLNIHYRMNIGEDQQ